MSAHLKDSHCSTCGAPYSTPEWPRTCAACGATAYRNPLPVAVTLLPVEDADGTGLVVITRTIEPALGGVALPGGFIDFGEDWRDAVVRELFEETGITAPASEVVLADALSSPGAISSSSVSSRPARQRTSPYRSRRTRPRAGTSCAPRRRWPSPSTPRRPRPGSRARTPEPGAARTWWVGPVSAGPTHHVRVPRRGVSASR